MEKVYLDNISDEILKISNFDFDAKEPEYVSLSPLKPNLYIWRIEKSSLKKWPKDSYGIFYEGDSFLVLKIENEKNIYAHVWIGKSSSSDEISFVICKLMQLDNFLKNKCIIFYECQGKESKQFLSYFKIFLYEKGGVEADLEAKKQKKLIMRLFEIHGSGYNVQVNQIPINKKNINPNNAYLFDSGINLFVYIGTSSNCFEKYKINLIAKTLKDKRQSKVNIIEVDEKGTNDSEISNKKLFDEMLEKFEENDIEETKNEDQNENKIKKMFKLSDESGKLLLEEVPIGKENLNSDDVFIIDKDKYIILYIGKGVSKNEKRFSRIYVNNYIKKQNKKRKIPIIVANEQNLSDAFDKVFQ